jgi:hypothetical protein
MSGQMDEAYYDHKKESALRYLANAVRDIQSAASFVSNTRYSTDDSVNPWEVHELLRGVSSSMIAARSDFEKSRWAAARTDLEFNEWLAQENLTELANS